MRSVGDRSWRVLGALVLALLPLGVIAALPVGAPGRILIAFASIVGASGVVFHRVRGGMITALATWLVALAAAGALPLGLDAGGLVVCGVMAGAALVLPLRDPHERSPRPGTSKVALAVAAGLAIWMVAQPPGARLDGDGPAHLGGIHDALAGDRWTPPDLSSVDTADAGTADPRFGVLHGFYAALTVWTGAPPDRVFALVGALLVPLGFLGCTAWMRSWSAPAHVAPVLALWMTVAGAGGRGFGLWRAAFPGDAAVLLAGFAIAGLGFWLRDERRGVLPWAAVVLLGASVAVHPFAWWIVVTCAGLATAVALLVRRHRALAGPLARFTLATAVLGGLVLLPRWTARGASTDGIHQVATDVVFLDARWFFVDPLALAHWGGATALLVGPLLLLAPRTWWSRPWAPFAAATALAGWVLALNPLLAPTAWSAVAYLLIRTFRLVITPWWWWSLLEHARRDWPDSGRAARTRLVVLGLVTIAAAGLDARVAWTVLAHGPPRNPTDVTARVEAMDRALERSGRVVIADPRTSYALRARRGGAWPLVPAAHSSPADHGLEERLAAFRQLHAAAVDSATWFAALDRLGGDGILVHLRPREFAPYDEFGWIPAEGAARRLERRLSVLLEQPEATGDGWSLWRRPERRRWRAAAERVDDVATGVDGGAAPLARASRFEVVGVRADTLRVRAGDTVEWALRLRARDGGSRTVHPGWEEVALRWRGPTVAVPEVLRPVDKLYRKLLVERSARSDARFAFGRIPFEGTWPARDWPNDRLVVDRFTVRVPRYATPGRYVIEVTIQERPWRPRRALRDLLRDDDRFTGPVVATVEVLPPAGR